MKRIFIILVALLFATQASAAILVMSQDGSHVPAPTLAAACSGVDTSGKTIVITGNVSVTDNLTVPSTRSMRIERGGIITVTAGKTLTINGPFEAGLYQVFGSTGTVSFGAGSTSTLIPQWFAGADSGLKLQAAVNALPATGGIVDGRGFTGSQTISSTVTWGWSSMAQSNHVKILLNPAAKFHPATTTLTMFNPQPAAQLSGLNVDATNVAYTGIVILVQDNSGVGGYAWNYTEGQNTLFENINMLLPTGGTAIKLSTVDTGAPGYGTGISFVTFRSVRIFGGAIGIKIYVDAASHFISSNVFQDVMISNAGVGVSIGSYPVIGTCFYNNFTDLSIQMGTPGVYGIEMLNGLGNQFINLAIWDPNIGAGAKTIYHPSTGGYKNIYMGLLGLAEATIGDPRNLFLDSGSGSSFNNEPTYRSLRTSLLTVEGPTYQGQLGAADTLKPAAEISKMFSVAAGASVDVATVKFDSAYAGAIITVELGGEAGSGMLARATRTVNMNNDSPNIVTIGTDTLMNCTIAFSYVASHGIKATITNTIGTSAVGTGAMRMHVVGGGQGLGILSIQ